MAGRRGCIRFQGRRKWARFSTPEGCGRQAGGEGAHKQEQNKNLEVERRIGCKAEREVMQRREVQKGDEENEGKGKCEYGSDTEAMKEVLEWKEQGDAEVAFRADAAGWDGCSRSVSGA